MKRNKSTPVIIASQKFFGELQLARNYAKGLLCQNLDSDFLPCNKCSSCLLFESGNHPDFFLISPDSLLEELRNTHKFVIEAPDSGIGSEKHLSQVIRIEQIRKLIQDIQIGSHQNGKRVAIIYPTENLQNASANTLLKTLEEPPSNVQFILITNRLDEILPTIRSRCEIFAIAKPNIEVSIEWLEKHALKKVTTPECEELLFQNSLSPIKVKEILDSGENLSLPFDFNQLHSASSGVQEILKRLPKQDISIFMIAFQKWCSDINFALHKLPVRFFPQYSNQIQSIANLVDPIEFESFLDILKINYQTKDNASLNLFLSVENLLTKYRNLTSITHAN